MTLSAFSDFFSPSHLFFFFFAHPFLLFFPAVPESGCLGKQDLLLHAIGEA